MYVIFHLMPSGKCDVSLILPAYNEAGTITRTLAEAVEYFRARSLTYEIIVAADGDDGTRELAREFAKTEASICVIGESGRRGKGKGIREGVMLAAGEIVGFADADNKVPIGEFGKLETFLHNGYEIAIGSRGLERSCVKRKQKLYRQIGSVGFGRLMHAVVGLPEITDTQCGFKFFHREVAQDLFRRQQIDGYMFDVEILVLAQSLGYRVREVPIVWSDDADSRLQLVSGNLRNVADLFKIRLTSMRQSEAPATVEAHVNSAPR